MALEMRFCKVCMLFVVAVGASVAVAQGIDDPAKPWSYFVHPVTCIGMSLQTASTGIQVTPEGMVPASSKICYDIVCRRQIRAQQVKGG